MNNEKKISLFDIKNYNNKITFSEIEITTKFYEIVNEYIFHICDNIIIQNKAYYIFIILRGLKTLKHIFITLLLYTKNLTLTEYHCKKAYLFYVEFMGQIGNDSHSYLQLNSKDAILFVYKKTIFDLNNEYRNTFVLKNDEEKDLVEYTNIITKLIYEIYDYNIDNDNISSEKKISYIMYLKKMTNKIINRINKLKIPIKKKINICKKYLYYKNLITIKNNEIDECLFFNLTNLFFKKFQNNKDISIEILNKKMYNNDYNYKLMNETPLKFTNWLFNSK